VRCCTNGKINRFFLSGAELTRVHVFTCIGGQTVSVAAQTEKYFEEILSASYANVAVLSLSLFCFLLSGRWLYWPSLMRERFTKRAVRMHKWLINWNLS
jgi:hypothetical protein